MLLTEYDLQIMKIVKVLRTSKRIKQETLASALKIDRTNYGRIENGESSFSPAQLHIISKELNVSIIQILNFTDKSLNGGSKKSSNDEAIVKYFSRH